MRSILRPIVRSCVPGRGPRAVPLLLIASTLWILLPNLSAQCICTGFNSARVEAGSSFVDGSDFSRARANLTDPAFFGPGGVSPSAVLIGGGVQTATAGTIGGATIFITGYTASGSYSAAERTIILNAVNNGMSLVVTDDDTGHSLADLFGVTVTDQGSDTHRVVVPDHPIFSGPFGRISQFPGAGASSHFTAWPDTAQLLAATKIGPSMLLIPRGALAPGSGAVLFLSDQDVLSTLGRLTHQNTSDPGLPVTDALMSNIVHFLCNISASSVAPHLVFAQFASGDSNISSLVLTATSQIPILSTNVRFLDGGGGPLAVSLQGFGTATTFNIGNMPENQTLVFTTPGIGNLQSGSVWIRGSAESGLLLAGNVLFFSPGQGVTGVAASQVAGGFDLPVVPMPGVGDVPTGFAATNMTGREANVRLELWDSTLGRRSDGILFIKIPAYGHIAQFLFQLYPAFDFEGFQGTLRVVGIDALLAVTALQLGGIGEFTALPVKPLYH